MGDWESKNYDDAAVPQDAHAMDRMQEHYDRINREIQRAEEEMLRRRQAQAPVYDPHGHPHVPMPRDPNDGLFGIPPADYDTWRNGKQQPTASQIDPKLLEKLRQHIGQHVVPAKPRDGHVPYVSPKSGIYQVNGRKVIVDEINDLFRDAYLGDYPHIEPMTRKQEVCRHHPVNVGFNTDKWVCKICDKDLDTPVDNSYK